MSADIDDLLSCCQTDCHLRENNKVEILLIITSNNLSAVKDKEEGPMDSEARPMKDETFGEYRFVA